jgi:hypothetical protein
MKTSNLKRLLAATVLSAGFASGSAMAGPIADTFLGGFDFRNSGDAAVLAKFEALSGNDYDNADLERDDSPRVTQDLATGLWILDDAPTGAGYFLLKFGMPAKKAFNTSFDTYFFQNSVEVSQLVFSASDVNFLIGGDCAVGNDRVCNVGRLSHWVFVAGDAVVVPPDVTPPPHGQVPEPASLALLGAGLAAMALRRSRSRNAT